MRRLFPRHRAYHLNMVVNIPDDALRQAGIGPAEVLLELACSLFQAEKLTLGPACRLAGLCRTDFEAELLRRQIPIYRYSEKDFEQDLSTLRHLGRLP